MLSVIPIAGCPVDPDDLLSGLRYIFNKSSGMRADKAISEFLNSEYVYFTNSATASLYIILEILKETGKRQEVILPAYTASSLINAVRRAGLKPVLCDISLDDFNMDPGMLADLISEDTLAVLAVHMFGIVTKDLAVLKKNYPGIFIIEDCAQSLGSLLNGDPAGNSGNLSLLSFSKGKNLPAYGGGCIATNDKAMAEKVKEKIETLEDQSLLFKLLVPFKILAFSLAVRPRFYGLFYRAISVFKEGAPRADFSVKNYTGFQEGVLLSLFEKIEQFSKKRYENGMKLIDGLKDISGVVLPEIPKDTQPAFNRMPVVFDDLKAREKAETDLWKKGIETSRMYDKPLHHMFDLGYKKTDLPNAVYFAEHLLTLPVHPLLTESDLDTIAATVRGIFN